MYRIVSYPIVLYCMFVSLLISVLFYIFRNSDTINVSFKQRMILSKHNIFLFILVMKFYRNQ